jgi:hypothetical protein
MLNRHFRETQDAFIQGERIMKKLVITTLLLSVAVAAPLFAQTAPCVSQTVFITGRLQSPQDYTVTWQPVPGATFYIVEENRAAISPEMIVTRQIHTDKTSVNITHEAINDVTYRYRIRALGAGVDCDIMSNHVRTLGDPVLRARIRRGIVPVVGSARGANGSLFKTYLKLEGASLKGRIIFHPANRVANDNDPSIPYDTTVKSASEWDDVVAAMGQSGTGSLSIVPDAGDIGLLPRATVRLYNVAANGIFGTTAELYPAVDFLTETSPFQRVEVPADGNFRANVGARAILDGVAVAVAIGADGVAKREVSRAFVAGETVFGSPEAVYGLSLAPGESLLVTFSRGIVPFFTLTDNRTNDPFLYVQNVPRRDVVDQYVR